MNGRGVVLAAGGPVPLANAYVTLHMLRKVHNCTLPIEIYHNGPYELDSMTQKAFEVRQTAEAEFQNTVCGTSYIQQSTCRQSSAACGVLILQTASCQSGMIGPRPGMHSRVSRVGGC